MDREAIGKGLGKVSCDNCELQLYLQHSFASDKGQVLSQSADGDNTEPRPVIVLSEIPKYEQTPSGGIIKSKSITPWPEPLWAGSVVYRDHPCLLIVFENKGFLGPRCVTSHI